MKKPDKIEVGQIWGSIPFVVLEIVNDSAVIARTNDGNETMLDIERIMSWRFMGYNARIMLKERLKREKNNAQQ